MLHVPPPRAAVTPLESEDRRLLPGGGASLASSIANLANTTIGVGILTLPAAFATAGLYPGLALLLALSAVTSCSSHLLSECADLVGRPCTYNAVAEAAFPRLGVSVLLDIALLANSWGICIAYYIVIADSMPPVLDVLVGFDTMSPWAAALLAGRSFWVYVTLVVVTPLCCLRRINDLQIPSLLVLLCVLCICGALAAFALAPSAAFDPCAAPAECDIGPITLSRPPLAVLRAVPPYIFSLGAEMNVVPVTNELERPTRSRAWSVFLGAYGISCLLYAGVASAGYATFGDSVASNVLLSYEAPAGSAAASTVSAVRLLQVYVALLSYPVVAYPCWSATESLLGVVTCGRLGGRGRAMLSDSTGSTFVTDTTQRCAIAVYVLGSAAVALVVADLGFIVDLVGASATAYIFILPGACYAVLFPKPRLAPKRLAALALGLSGLVVIPGCIASVLS